MAGEPKILTVGADASALDIFLSAGGSPIDASSVGFELFDAAGVSAASGIALNPQVGQYTGDGVIPAGFELGTWSVHWNIITAALDWVRATEKFCVQAISVQIGFVPLTDKTGSIYEAVRIDIGDPDGQVFDDAFMSRVLTKAARRLDHRLGLSRTQRPKGIPGGIGANTTIKVGELTVNVETGVVSPNNDEIVDLLIMQMEVIIIEGETSALKRLSLSGSSGAYQIAVGNAGKDGVTVKNSDGVEVSVSVGRLQTRATLQRLDAATRRAELEGMIKVFLGRLTGGFGKMVW